MTSSVVGAVFSTLPPDLTGEACQRSMRFLVSVLFLVAVLELGPLAARLKQMMVSPPERTAPWFSAQLQALKGSR